MPPDSPLWNIITVIGVRLLIIILVIFIVFEFDRRQIIVVVVPPVGVPILVPRWCGVHFDRQNHVVQRVVSSAFGPLPPRRSRRRNVLAVARRPLFVRLRYFAPHCTAPGRITANPHPVDGPNDHHCHHYRHCGDRVSTAHEPCSRTSHDSDCYY